jgi:hypothetical protein
MKALPEEGVAQQVQVDPDRVLRYRSADSFVRHVRPTPLSTRFKTRSTAHWISILAASKKALRSAVMRRLRSIVFEKCSPVANGNVLAADAASFKLRRSSPPDTSRAPPVSAHAGETCDQRCCLPGHIIRHTAIWDAKRCRSGNPARGFERRGFKASVRQVL